MKKLLTIIIAISLLAIYAKVTNVYKDVSYLVVEGTKSACGQVYATTSGSRGVLRVKVYEKLGTCDGLVTYSLRLPVGNSTGVFPWSTVIVNGKTWIRK